MSSGLGIPSNSPTGSVAAYLMETLIVLFAVTVLAVFVLWIAKRAGVGRISGPCRLVARFPLDNRRCLYLVRVNQWVLVLGASEAGITRLWKYRDDSPLPPSSNMSSGFRHASFADVLGRLRSGLTPNRKQGEKQRDLALDRIEAIPDSFVPDSNDHGVRIVDNSATDPPTT